MGWKSPKKPLAESSKGETTASNFNNRGLNVIFMVVSLEEFRRISNCEVARDVWVILKVTDEGTKGLRLLNFRC